MVVSDFPSFLLATHILSYLSHSPTFTNPIISQKIKIYQDSDSFNFCYSLKPSLLKNFSHHSSLNLSSSTRTKLVPLRLPLHSVFLFTSSSSVVAAPCSCSSTLDHFTATAILLLLLRTLVASAPQHQLHRSAAAPVAATTLRCMSRFVLDLRKMKLPCFKEEEDMIFGEFFDIFVEKVCYFLLKV